jgi:hypothetical protein
MPKDKKRSKKESDSESDSGPDDKGPAKKQSKPAASSAGSSDAEPSWLLGGMKFAKVREFKGKTYIDIREYYVDKSTMETKPGKKGISMNCEQYQKLKSIISEIDAALP